MGGSALIGRALLPDLLGTDVQPRPSGSEVRAQMLEIRRDFDALVATLRAFPASSWNPTVIFLTAEEEDALNIRRRVNDLGRRIDEVQSLTHEARTHYRSAIDHVVSAVERAERRESGNKTVVADLLNRAEAEWRKGDDTLK